MLAIHDSSAGFHPRWVDYCRRNDIPHKLVDCYANDVLEQLGDCRALLWHHSHSEPRNIVIAQQVLFALEHAGVTVFPNFSTSWHFDDKVGQKYLFEAFGIPTLPTYVFMDKKSALSWASEADYPTVFKLRHGASSSCVRIVQNKKEARRIIRRAFGRGFPVYDPWYSLKERFRKWRSGQTEFLDLLKGLGRLVHPPRFSKVLGQQIGYVLFQDFAIGNDSDLRITVVGDKAFGFRRWARLGDFRASGSGITSHDPDVVDIQAVSLAFSVAEALGSSSLACDILRRADGSFAIVEVSYAFGEFRGKSPGFWDRDLNWHTEKFRPEDWIMNKLLADLNKDYRSVTSGSLVDDG